MVGERVGAASMGPNSFNNLPWFDSSYVGSPEVDPIPDVPNAHFRAVYETYGAVCGGVVGSRDDQAIRMMAAQNPAFLQTYAAYAATFSGGFFGRGLSYRSTWGWESKAEWIRDDFGKWLDGGRRCPAGTFGYEQLMPSPQMIASTATNSAHADISGRMRSAARAILDTNLFHLNRDIGMAILNESFEGAISRSQRSRTRFLRRAGFQPVLPKDSRVAFYRNAAGDILHFDYKSIVWGSADNVASLGAGFHEDHLGVRRVSSYLPAVIRNGRAESFPLDGHADDLIAYVEKLDGGKIPGAARTLPLADVLGAYGYFYLGGDNPDEMAEQFKHSAMDHEGAKTRLSVWQLAERHDGAVQKRLAYKAAEYFYLASAAFLAAGDLRSSRSLLRDMTRCLLAAGLKWPGKVEKVEAALERLMERDSARRNSRPPSSGGPTPVMGGFSPSGEAGSAGSPIPQAPVVGRVSGYAQGVPPVMRGALNLWPAMVPNFGTRLALDPAPTLI